MYHLDGKGYVGKESCDHAKDAQYFLPHLVFLSVYYLFQEVGSCSLVLLQYYYYSCYYYYYYYYYYY